MAPRGAIPVSAFSEPPFRLHRNGGSDLLFDAFSSREPATTSLENALVTMMLDDHDLVVMMPALDHDSLGARDRRRRDRDHTQCGDGVSKSLHCCPPPHFARIKPRIIDNVP